MNRRLKKRKRLVDFVKATNLRSHPIQGGGSGVVRCIAEHVR